MNHLRLGDGHLDGQRGDANDIRYALDASKDYDPGAGLEKIAAPLLAVNSADDLINPPALGILPGDQAGPARPRCSHSA